MKESMISIARTTAIEAVQADIQTFRLIDIIKALCTVVTIDRLRRCRGSQICRCQLVSFTRCIAFVPATSTCLQDISLSYLDDRGSTFIRCGSWAGWCNAAHASGACLASTTIVCFMSMARESCDVMPFIGKEMCLKLGRKVRGPRFPH